MAEFRFTTVWHIEAPLAQVSDAISHVLQWPRWWKGVERVEELEAGDADGLGSLRRFTWRGRLPYRLRFDVRVTQIIPLSLVEGRASGEVEGVGRWLLSSDGTITAVRYEWHVRTNRPWMNIAARFGRPLFRWNHDQVMRQGAEGMSRLLNARLLDIVHH